MQASSPTETISTGENLLTEDYDRLQLRLRHQFGRQLRNIPDAPTPDDLLHDTIEDLGRLFYTFSPFPNNPLLILYYGRL